MSDLAIANTVAILTPILAFFAGISFAKWMRQRRRARMCKPTYWVKEHARR